MLDSAQKMWIKNLLVLVVTSRFDHSNLQRLNITMMANFSPGWNFNTGVWLGFQFQLMQLHGRFQPRLKFQFQSDTFLKPPFCFIEKTFSVHAQVCFLAFFGLRFEYNYMRLNPSAWADNSSTVSETEMEISAQDGVHLMQKLSSVC